VLLINGPLLKFKPAWALREGELMVALGMMLVSCSLPSSGLMRYLPGGMMGIYGQAATNADYAAVLKAANLPTWLWPAAKATDPAGVANENVFRYFLTRSPDGSVPWGAWVRPLALWGIFVACLWGLMLCLSIIVRRQWTENERLAFPLATVYAALIESPAPGRALNTLFRAPGFWIAAALVFAAHSVNAIHQYVPSFPTIPLGYDMNAIFTEAPWQYIEYGAKQAMLYFSIIGIAYFVQTRVAFSVWGFYILWQLAEMLIEGGGMTFTDDMRQNQTFGGMAVFTGVVLFIGRQHWWMVIRHMLPFLKRESDMDEPSRYLPYAAAGWGAVLCATGAGLWLMAAGVSLVATIAILACLMMMFMTVARIVAETGLIFTQLHWQMYRLWYYPLQMIGPAATVDSTSFFFTGWMAHTFHDVRESFAAFFQQGVRVADATAYENSHRWRTGFGFILAIVLALVVGYCVSSASMLWVEYNYAEPLGLQPDSTVNSYGTESAVRQAIFDPAVKYANKNITETPLAQGVNIGIGGAIVAVCSVLRLTLSWWPLHPIGFIIVYSYATQKIWFSVFLGWLAKSLLLRLGGASLLLRVKPVFIGLIVGEAFAAAFWLVFSLVVHSLGYEYHRIVLLPG
jgi:hypothetical protein